MDESQTKTPNEQGKAAENFGNGSEPKNLSLIEQANALRQTLDEKERSIIDKIDKFERRLAEQILSGKTDIVPQKSQTEKDSETAKKIADSFFR